MAQKITTNLGELSGVQIGVEREFTVTVDEDGATGNVRGMFKFGNYSADNIVLKYKAPDATAFSALTVNSDGEASFGPEAGFALADGTHTFKITFNTAKTYSYNLSLLNVANGSAVATTQGSVTAGNFNEPTIDGTLDIIKDIQLEQDVEWQVYINGFDRVGDMVNVQIKLQDPSQRDKFTLMYNKNREVNKPEKDEFVEVTFDETGLATIGAEEGEALTESYKEYFKINFKEEGAYTYDLILRRIDGNSLAKVTETARVGTVAAIDDRIGNEKVVVYPTVSKGLVRLNLGSIRNAQVVVTDLLGRKVLELQQANGIVEINTQKYAKGTYLVKVMAEGDAASSRLVVR